MTATKSSRFVGIGSTTYLKFNLDPDIYKGDVLTALGVTVAAPTGAGVEIVPYTLKLAKRSTAVSILRVKIERGTGEDQETRTMRLVCDRQNADTAQAALLGKTVQIGPANSTWTIRA